MADTVKDLVGVPPREHLAVGRPIFRGPSKSLPMVMVGTVIAGLTASLASRES